MNNSPKTTETPKAVKFKPIRKMPWRKRLLRFLDHAGHYLGRWGISFSGVYLLNSDTPPDMTDRESDPTLVFEELNPHEIPKMKEYRDEAQIRARLDKGYCCWVAKNRHGEIDQLLWFTNRPYYCWPIRTMIDPGPRGWYCFDGYTMAHARRLHRFSQNFSAWYNSQPPDMGPVVGIVSLWNDAAFNADRKLGYFEVCRVYCISVFGFKLVRVRWVLPEPSVQWIARSRGKTLTYDACKLRIY